MVSMEQDVPRRKQFDMGSALDSDDLTEGSVVAKPTFIVTRVKRGR